MVTKELDVLLKEERVFRPAAELVEQSNIKKWMAEHKIGSYEELLSKAQNIEWYWSEVAKELDWYKPWRRDKRTRSRISGRARTAK
jgi:acetyl-CoA synthetase